MVTGRTCSSKAFKKFNWQLDGRKLYAKVYKDGRVDVPMGSWQSNAFASAELCVNIKGTI